MGNFFFNKKIHKKIKKKNFSLLLLNDSITHIYTQCIVCIPNNVSPIINSNV